MTPKFISHSTLVERKLYLLRVALYYIVIFLLCKCSPFFFQCIATMETSGSLVVQSQPRDEWSCATMRPGAPSVMNSGQPAMRM